MNRAGCSCVFASLLIAGTAQAQNTARFDSLSEGVIGFTYTENLITFSDLDIRFPGQSGPYQFIAEDASADLAANPNFSSPNALGFAGWSPGTGAAYTRFGTMTMKPPQDGSMFAAFELHVFGFGEPGNSINLIGFQNGTEVTRHAINIPNFGFNSYALELPLGIYDEVRLVGEGPVDLGVMFALVDNVEAVLLSPPTCYANCDGSTNLPVLNVADFSCFLTRFAAADPYANCDESTSQPTLNVADFSCFLTKFAAGCS